MKLINMWGRSQAGHPKNEGAPTLLQESKPLESSVLPAGWGRVLRLDEYTASAQKKSGVSNVVRFASKTCSPSKMANSESFFVMSPSGRSLRMRRWWPVDTDPKDLPEKGAALLIVPGLGGKTEWGTPMVSEFIKNHPLVYGMDTQSFGSDPTKKGHLNHRSDLVNEIKETVDWIKEKHGKNVYIIGVSLGGLAVTHLVAEHPQNVAGVILISPAYRPARESFSPYFYLKSFVRMGLENLGLIKREPISMPYKDDTDMLAEAPAWLKEAKDQVSALTTRSLLQMFLMTWESFGKAKKVKVPVLGVIPEKDTICSPDAMLKGFQSMPSKDKEILTYKGAHHNIIFEKQVLFLSQTVNEWLTRQKNKVTNA